MGFGLIPRTFPDIHGAALDNARRGVNVQVHGVGSIFTSVGAGTLRSWSLRCCREVRGCGTDVSPPGGIARRQVREEELDFGAACSGRGAGPGVSGVLSWCGTFVDGAKESR